MQAAEVLDHFPTGHAVVDRRVGRDKPDLAPDRRGVGDHIESVDLGRTAGRAKHCAEDSQDRRLAGAVGPQQAEDLPWPGVEADSAQGHDLPSPQIGIVLRQLVDVDHSSILISRV